MKLGGLDHPKVFDLATRLGIPRVQAIGHLELLWAWCAGKTPQGNVGKWPDGVIAMACDWTGSPSKFIGALVDARLLDCCSTHRLVVHDWHEHAPSWVRANLSKAGLQFAKATSVPTSERSSEATSEASSDGDQSASTRARVSKPSQAKPSQVSPYARDDDGNEQQRDEEPTGSAHDAIDELARKCADMARPLREQGVKVTSIHPTLIAWVTDGYTLEQVLGALAIARETKGEDANIHAKYLDAVLRDPSNAPRINRNARAVNGTNGNGKHAPVRRSVDEAEDEIIIRAIRDGLTDEQIVGMEDLAIAPNLPQRIRAKRQELQREQH